MRPRYLTCGVVGSSPPWSWIGQRDERLTRPRRSIICQRSLARFCGENVRRLLSEYDWLPTAGVRSNNLVYGYIAPASDADDRVTWPATGPDINSWAAQLVETICREYSPEHCSQLDD